MNTYDVSKAMDNALQTLNSANPESKEYQNALKAVTTLRKFEERFVDKLDPNTILGILGSLVLTLVVLYYEKTDIIKSKAFAMIPRLPWFSR